MRTAKQRKKYIFCLEGDWTDDLRKKHSIESALQFLEVNTLIKYIHRNCSTIEEFANRIHEYRKADYNDFSICYLAFHGKPNGILIGKNLLTFDEIAKIAEGQLKNKIIHLGACSSLDLDRRHVKRFIRKTSALCVSGYKSDVDFLPSSVFDMLYFEMWQHHQRVKVVEKYMNHYYGTLVKELKFSIIYI